MPNDEKEQDLFESLIMQLIIEAVRESEKIVKVINPARYMDVLLAKDAMDDLLMESGENEKAAVRFHHAFSSASVSAEVDQLEVLNIGEFFAVESKASNFEIYPLTNGRVSISFMFKNVLIPVQLNR